MWKTKCKYITKKESFNYLKDTTESYYITSVYSKLDKLDSGEVWIELLKDKVIQGPQKSLPFILIKSFGSTECVASCPSKVKYRFVRY